MRILITTFGSRGDVQPMLALGLGLKACGQEVVIGAAPNYRAWTRELGLDFREIGGDFEPWLRRQSAGNPFSVLRSLAMYLREELPVCFAHTREAARGADLIVTTIHLAALSAAEAEGIPCRTVLFSTQLLPSSFHPPPGLPVQSLPRLGNRVAWRAVSAAFDLLFKKGVNRERAKLGLAPIAQFLAHARGAETILAADPELAPLPPDAAGAVQTGAMTLPETGPLDQTLEEFLRQGPAPVYFGFGSTPDKQPEDTAGLITEAARAAGQRAIVCAGWSGLGGAEPGPGFFAIAQAPHGLLFPRVAAVVHHGGAGTTAAALRAGAPQILIPHLGDQFFHARRVRELGVGPEPIPRGKLTALRLAAAIDEALKTEVRQRAQELAGRLRARDGVAETIARLLP